jgi:hypothetical protein
VLFGTSLISIFACGRVHTKIMHIVRSGTFWPISHDVARPATLSDMNSPLSMERWPCSCWGWRIVILGLNWRRDQGSWRVFTRGSGTAHKLCPRLYGDQALPGRGRTGDLSTCQDRDLWISLDMEYPFFFRVVCQAKADIFRSVVVVAALSFLASSLYLVVPLQEFCLPR